MIYERTRKMSTQEVGPSLPTNPSEASNSQAARACCPRAVQAVVAIAAVAEAHLVMLQEGGHWIQTCGSCCRHVRRFSSCKGFSVEWDPQRNLP
eukprot:CAMPEP_0172795776 /NCGR_PEP_ID=MMETSP1074-20121228/210654_1 /TAXON_ID=2916 /ORGANISM="Ceratium fusus, Strain PA161109" /LENGTH=93 /DNA_ID=CAMNT_0013632865 /DNA_START=467 /DNA_END=748 /DNA_ORIENTATION=-